MSIDGAKIRGLLELNKIEFKKCKKIQVQLKKYL